MSDWHFLHDMHNDGYSPEQIADAAACGYNPWEWVPAREQDLHPAHPQVDPELVMLFEALVDNARSYYGLTNRYLQIWGELGEIYAEIWFGLRRHATHWAGSDGAIADKLVEVKTISPEKASDRVLVKSQGNFEQLLIIRIDRDFQFRGKLLERSELKGVAGKFLRGQFKDDASEA